MTRGVDVSARLDDSQSWGEEFYQHLHAHPELSSQEVQTAAEVARRLEPFGYEVQAAGGGVVGVLTNGPGRTVLTRADMDALPVTELPLSLGGFSRGQQRFPNLSPHFAPVIQPTLDTGTEAIVVAAVTYLGEDS